MKKIIQLIKKDFIRFSNDTAAVLLTFIVPAVLIFVFGNIFGGNEGSRGKATILFVNESSSLVGKFLEEKLDSSKSVGLKKTFWDEEKKVEYIITDSIARQSVISGDYSAALIFPPDFFADTSSGIKMKIYYDPKNEIESQMIEGALQQSIMGQMSKLFPVLMSRQMNDMLGEFKGKEFTNDFKGLIGDYFEVDLDTIEFNMSLEDSSFLYSSDTSASGASPDFMNSMIEFEKEQLVGAEIKNPQVTRIVGGWAMMFLLFTLTGAATSFFEEKSDGTLKRLLCMPIKRDYIIISKFIYSVILGFIQLAVLFSLAWLIFDVDIFSNFFNLIIIIFVAASAAVAFGMLITVFSDSINQASGYSTFLILLMSSIGGAWFPTFLFPEWLQVASKFTLVYWAVEAFQNVLWRNSPLSDLVPHLVILSTIAVTVNLYAIYRFKNGKMFR